MLIKGCRKALKAVNQLRKIVVNQQNLESIKLLVIASSLTASSCLPAPKPIFQLSQGNLRPVAECKQDMRFLVVNDDGPPGPSSPFIFPFIAALQAAGHACVVVIPDRPMSWIGKAHCFGKVLTARSVCPAEYSGQSCTNYRCDEAENRWHRWLIVDGPPASCAQLGMFNAGVDTADFDMIISGPNWGRNAGRLYNLSSGTVGGALEGALGGIKAVALSFATKDAQPDDIISEACAKSVEVIGNLSLKWHPEVDLYNVNIPMVKQLAGRQVRYTTPSRTFWAGDSLFEPVEKSCEEEKVSRVYQFRWAPELKAHKQQSLQSPEGEDLWASLNGFISVTPMKANFEVVTIAE